MGWTALLAAAALLLALGSKISGVATRVLLAFVTKCGLLANIRASDAALVSLTVGSVRFAFWASVWRFLHAPTQHPLLRIQALDVRVRVVVKENAAPREALGGKEQRRDDPLQRLGSFSCLDVSFKDLRHSAWAPVCAWIHRFHFVCYFVHLVALSASSIAVDVVHESAGGDHAVVILKHGSVEISASYDSKAGEVLGSVRVSRDNSNLEIDIPAVSGAVEIGPVELTMSIPASCGGDDFRAPIPNSCFLTCDYVYAQADLVECVGAVQRQGRANSYENNITTSSRDSRDNDPISSLLVLRLVGVLPSEASVLLRQVELKLFNKTSVDSAAIPLCCTFSGLSLRTMDSSNSLLGRIGRTNDNSVTDERKTTLELGALNTKFQASQLESLSLLKLGALKCEIESRLACCSESMYTSDDDDETSESGAVTLLSCCSRISGELRGLMVSVSAYLEPWVSGLYAEVGRVEDAFSSQTDNIEVALDQACASSFWENVAMEMEVQFKVTQVEAFFQSLDTPCAILSDRLPNMLLTLEEVNVFAHPFVGDQTLGVRSKADIQCSRLKILSCGRDKSTRTCFISLDFTRVFVEPTSLMNVNQSPANVEMEAEWLEVKWTPQALHAVGGAIELGIFVAQAFLKEDARFEQEWDAEARTCIPAMTPIEDVCLDKLADSETVKFRCSVKRVLVLFSHTFDEQNHVDYLTVDSLAMSVEESTGRFRISVLQIKVYHAEPDKERSFTTPSFVNQRPPRRTSSTFATKRMETSRKRLRNDGARNVDAKIAKSSKPYFTVQTFALEENKLPGCPKTVVDILVDGVDCEWEISAQLRIMELVRRITFSTWEMLFMIRRGYAVYCTPPESRYNRLGGVNPPMADSGECEQCSALLSRLISAGGDSLNRLLATNIDLRAKALSETQLQLHIGHFGGDDLPDLWRFEDISLHLNALNLLAVESVRVRHTVDKRVDYVFGEFEEMLLLRMEACGKRGRDTSRNDGMLIDVEGVRIRLSTEVPFLRHMTHIQAMVEPFMGQLEAAAKAFWRPQNTIFYQYFMKTPSTPSRPKVWLSIEKLSLECLETPLESWLERMYPLWLEELQEQALREQVLEEQIMTLKLTNTEMPCEDAFEEMKAQLAEKNAKIYLKKAKKAQGATHQMQNDADGTARNTLFSVRIQHISADVSFNGDKRKTIRLMHSLDEASQTVEEVFARFNQDFSTYAPVLDMLEDIMLSVSVEESAVQLRSFATPLLLCNQLALSGSMIAAVPSKCGGSTTSFAARLRCYANVRVEIVTPIAFFSPAYLFTLDEIACLASSLVPLLVFDIDKQLGTPPWDIARRLFHGTISLLVQDAALRLLNCSTSFTVSDYLEISVGRLLVDYSYGKTNLNVHRLATKIDPGAISNIVEVSNVGVEIWMKWSNEGNSAIHFGFPIEYCGDEKNGQQRDCVYLDSWAARLVKREQLQTSQHTMTNHYPLKQYQATGLSVYIRGAVSPWNVGGDQSFASTIKRTKHEVSTRTAIVMYTKHVEWLLHFASLYLNLPPYAIPRRSRRSAPIISQPSSPLLRFLSIFQGVVIEEFVVMGLDLALYQSEKNPIGIRAFVNDRVTIAGAALVSTHEIFQTLCSPKKQTKKTRRLQALLGGQVWIVHDVSVEVQDIQVRVCTRQSGSRGDSLVTVKHLALQVGGGSEKTPTHDGSVQLSQTSQSRTANEIIDSLSNRNSRDESRTRAKKSILDHFSIQQHNPYCFRDSDHDMGATSEIENDDETHHMSNFVEEFRRHGFLMGLSAREARILVTMEAVEALVDIVENWIRIATVSVPELFGGLNELPVTNEKANTTAVQEDPSPRKATQLAEDPKFGAIFYESVVRDEANSFVSRLLPPVFASGDMMQVSKKDDTDQPLDSAGANSIVEPFFMVKFADCQVSVQDPIHKGSILLALSCGRLKDSISLDGCHELVDLKVDGVQLFTAPLDIDVKSRIVWLKTLTDGSYCPSSQGILTQVIAPIPAKVAIWIDRNVSVLNKVNLQIPAIDVGLNVTSKDILQNLALSLTSVITAKIGNTGSPDYSKMIKDVFSGDCTDPRSIPTLRALKKQLKWKIAELQWRETCRWSGYVAERAKVAFAAAENSRSLAFEMETSPLFRARNASSASLSSLGTVMSVSPPGLVHRDIGRQSVEDMLQLTQQHETISEMLRNLVKQKLKSTEQQSNVELEFVLQSASLTLSSANFDIVRVRMSTLQFKMKQFEDQSGAFTVTLQELSAQNLCPGTSYPDLLQPSSTSTTWGGGDAILWVDSEIAAPVGGVTVVKHFEVNVHPLQVCITQKAIMHLVAFFSTPAASKSAQEKHDEARSNFLQARHANSSGDGLVGSALKKAAKVAGKAANPLGLGKSHKDDARGAGRTRSFSSTQDQPQASLSKMGVAAHANETQLLLHGDDDPPSLLTPHDPTAAADREVSEANDRGKLKKILFKHIRIGAVEVVVTYKNKKSHHHNQQPLEDMRGFEVKVHALVYCDKTCSIMDLMLRIRRDVILDVLSQVGRNFTNIANFLRDQVDITRWGQFDALAPLKTLSTTVTSLAGAATPSSSVVPTSTIPPTKTAEPSPRARAATAPPSAQDTAHKFQLELPESHPALRKKNAATSLRPAEAVGKAVLLSPSSSLSDPFSRREGAVDSFGANSDSDHLSAQRSHQQHRSTTGKAKHAITHLFAKKRSEKSSASDERSSQ